MAAAGPQYELSSLTGGQLNINGPVPGAIPTQSLGAAEAGQATPTVAEPYPVSATELNGARSKYAGMLAVSELQEQDPVYQHVRAFVQGSAFLQQFVELEFEESWVELHGAIASGEDERVRQLAYKSLDKYHSFIKMTQARNFMTGLNRPRARDLRVFLNYLGLSSEKRYLFSTQQWKTLLDPPRFADWARSIVMNNKERPWVAKCLRFVVPLQNIIIGGKKKPLEDLGNIINLIEMGASLSASMFFGAPLVILASEAFVRWVNIVVLVVWVVMFLMFLVWWGVDSSYMFLYVLGYTTMLSNVNVGGQVGDSWTSR